MTIKKLLDGDKLTLILCGRLDTVTAPELKEVLDESISDITDLVLDFSDLEYISSAGLRVLVAAQKKMTGDKSMVIKEPNDIVTDAFEITGLISVFTIV